jgi:hypothetical protein
VEHLKVYPPITGHYAALRLFLYTLLVWNSEAPTQKLFSTILIV